MLTPKELEIAESLCDMDLLGTSTDGIRFQTLQRATKLLIAEVRYRRTPRLTIEELAEMDMLARFLYIDPIKVYRLQTLVLKMRAAYTWAAANQAALAGGTRL